MYNQYIITYICVNTLIDHNIWYWLVFIIVNFCNENKHFTCMNKNVEKMEEKEWNTNYGDIWLL